MHDHELPLVLALLKHLGIEGEHRGDIGNDAFPWDGKTINLDFNIIDVYHDIGHWVITPQIRRANPYFGLRTPDGLVDGPDEEEGRASILSILIMRSLGLDWESHYEDHGWYAFGWRAVRRVVGKMQGTHLTGTRPICLMNFNQLALKGEVQCPDSRGSPKL